MYFFINPLIYILVDKIKEELEALKKRVEELEKLIKSIQEQLIQSQKEGPKIVQVPVKSDPIVVQSAPAAGVDMSQVEKLIANLKLELIKIFASKDDFSALLKRIDNLDNLTNALAEAQDKTKLRVDVVIRQTGENTEDITKLKEKIKQLEDKLAGKVDCEEYDKLIALINQMRSSGGSGPAQPVEPILPSKDLNKLKELVDKIPNIEKQLDILNKYFYSACKFL